MSWLAEKGVEEEDEDAIGLKLETKPEGGRATVSAGFGGICLIAGPNLEAFSRFEGDRRVECRGGVGLVERDALVEGEGGKGGASPRGAGAEGGLGREWEGSSCGLLGMEAGVGRSCHSGGGRGA